VRRLVQASARGSVGEVESTIHHDETIVVEVGRELTGGDEGR
jgi:hypothetical protein